MEERTLEIERGDYLLVNYPRSSLKDEPCADRYGVIVSNHISVCVCVLENIEDCTASLGEELRLIEI
jgi:hypothetical protein